MVYVFTAEEPTRNTTCKTQYTDINECETSKNGCPGPCINKQGSYKCKCKIPGYKPSSKPYFCEDVDECRKKNGGCDDRCVNSRGSYECRCEKRGWKLSNNNHSCEDVNECERYGLKICHHGECINSIGSYKCVCNPGFSPGKRARYCQDNNECLTDNGGCEDNCINTEGSYKCNCTKPGFTLTSNGFNCHDIDECQINNGGCDGRCFNKKGSFKCSCPKVGQVLGADNKSCVPCGSDEIYNKRLNRCVKCPDNAQTKADVKVAVSDEDCECKLGFEGQPALLVPCQDINECEIGVLKCEFKCVNTIGSAHCICPVGFQLSVQHGVCEDKDECTDNSNVCHQKCTNVPGSYVCSCDAGYILHDDEHSCTDIDECELPTTKCPHKCANLNGSYVCTCPVGNQYNNRTNRCEDIDECRLPNPPCTHACTNIPGSFLCNCNGTGFKLSWDNNACIDINECMEGDNPCGDSCQNTIGSFKCECNKMGFTSSEDGHMCIDINECESNTTKYCDQLCSNLPGSYRCSCHPGYRQHGSTKCAVCPIGSYRGVRDRQCMRCPLNAITDEAGATSLVECVCRKGYRGDPSRGLKCKDIDECADNKNGCSDTCVNNAGSSYCLCNEGYKLDLDRKTCVDKDECTTNNGGCEQSCYNEVGSFKCNCTTGYTLAQNGKRCKDIDECLDEDHGCPQRCVNTRGGYRCDCHMGHGLTYDNKTCEDVNECDVNNGHCTDVCINTVGSYECKCTIPGYILYGDGKQCVDINECEDKTLCEDQCENTHGSYKCICTGGNVNLAADGRSCDDFDECAINGSNVCDQICINLKGTYRCDCYPGYYRTGSKCQICPINSYRTANMPESTCLRCPKRSYTPGAGASTITECECSPGYHIESSDSKECTDIDECSENFRNISKCEHKCNNLPGSYFCSCPRGQRLLANRKSCDAKVNCQPIKRPKKAIIWPPDCTTKGRRRLTPGFMCSTRCHHGYVMTGSRLRTCLNVGQFSGIPAKCSLIKCRGLRTVPNGKLYPPRCRSREVPVGLRCRVKCNKGFVLRGKAGTKCRATRRWSHRLKSTCLPEK